MLRRPRPPLKPEVGEDEAGHLLVALRNASTLIANYLDRHKLARGGGNHDSHTRMFIQDIFDFWCEYFTGEVLADGSRWFCSLLNAGWQDLGFAVDDEDGRSLEDWLC